MRIGSGQRGTRATVGAIGKTPKYRCGFDLARSQGAEGIDRGIHTGVQPASSAAHDLDVCIGSVSKAVGEVRSAASTVLDATQGMAG